MYGALFAFWGVRYSWQTAAESQRPPRGSALACPHCLAGDRSDTEANTCSSEDRDLAKRWPLCNPPIHTHTTCIHVHTCQMYITPLTSDMESDLEEHVPHCWLRLRLLYVFVSFRRSDNLCEPHKPNVCCINTPGILNRPGHLQPCRCFRLQAHLWSVWLSNSQ